MLRSVVCRCRLSTEVFVECLWEASRLRFLLCFDEFFGVFRRFFGLANTTPSDYVTTEEMLCFKCGAEGNDGQKRHRGLVSGYLNSFY